MGPADSPGLIFVYPPTMSQPKRILIYGVTGSGKSTLGRQIADATGLPYSEADSLTWEPNWVQVSKEIQRERIAELCAGEEWVLDSAYGSWKDIVFPRTELIIGLDYPRWLSLSRLFKRTVARVRDKKLVCNGNVETLRQVFSNDSILLWHFRSFKRKRIQMRAWQVELGETRVLIFKHPREAVAWLATLSPRQ